MIALALMIFGVLLALRCTLIDISRGLLLLLMGISLEVSNFFDHLVFLAYFVLIFWILALLKLKRGKSKC